MAYTLGVPGYLPDFDRNNRGWYLDTPGYIPYRGHPSDIHIVFMGAFEAHRYLEEDRCGFGVLGAVDLVEHRNHRIVQHLRSADLYAGLGARRARHKTNAIFC